MVGRCSNTNRKSLISIQRNEERFNPIFEFKEDGREDIVRRIDTDYQEAVKTETVKHLAMNFSSSIVREEDHSYRQQIQKDIESRGSTDMVYMSSLQVGRSQGVVVAIQGAEPRSITRSRISFKDERNSEIDEEHRGCQRISRVTSSNPMKEVNMSSQSKMSSSIVPKHKDHDSSSKSTSSSGIRKSYDATHHRIRANKRNQRISLRSVQAKVKGFPRRQVKFLTTSIGSFVNDSSSQQQSKQFIVSILVAHGFDHQRFSRPNEILVTAAVKGSSSL
ncbi:unnamed protein product [Caenorhabditis brenneri]